MDKRKTKVYTYTRVSTAMQIDGYSLDAQKSRMKAFAEYNDYEIVREYEDAGKSGKSIEGRVQFSQMMDDIKEGKDGVSYVLVFKLSRFGRNAADVLSTLQIMQDFGVNLICVEDGIDSSKDAGKLMISVLSAVAEIERENIRVQTMEGRIQKAREGKWNGGFAPYGYQLVDGKLEINEEEAVAIRVIFDQYVNTNIGSNGIAKYLENHGIRKIQRQNGKNPLFDAHLVRLILRNPVYCGKIAYGRRRTEKVHGTRNDYHLVEQENYLLVDGLHEAIVSEEIWQAAQVKLLAQAKKYEHVNKGKDTRTHLLSGIVKCPVCGAGMYGNKCIKHKKDGTKYKDFYYYGCKHRTMTRGHKCDYRKQINEELLDDAVAEIIVALVSKPKFATMMQEKINMKVDTSTIDQEVANHEKQLRQYYSTKSKLMEEIDSLDPDDRHYIKRKADLDDRLYRMYDKIEEEENLLVEARAKKQAIEAEKLTADNIYKVLIYFEKLYGVMNDVERRRFIEALISEIQIFPERQPNGQWLKSIKFKLPIIGENMELSLDNDKHVDKEHLHNHLIFNAVSFVDYKKYHSNKQSYHAIRRTSDRICKEHGLSVVVPGQDKGKSYAEYTAEKQGTSYKAKLKTAIDTLIPQVKDFDELLRRLQEMGYEIKQGKYISFRAAGQERFTRTKTLGAAYTEEAIKERIKGVYVAKTKTLREDKKIRLVVDLENSIKAQQSAGYERWAKIHNLKQAAKSMNFLTENKIEYYSELESKIADIMTAHDAAAKAVKEVEQRMSDLSLLIKHTTTYRQLKPIYDEYRKSPDKEKYLRGHESEIILFEAAARALKEMQIKKLPDLAALRKEYRSLNDRKTKLYEDYRQAKKQMQEYGVVKKNVDSILYPSQSRAREQER